MKKQKTTPILTLEQLVKTPNVNIDNENIYANKILRLALTKDKTKIPLYQKLSDYDGRIGQCAKAAIMFTNQGYQGVIKELENVNSEYDRLALFRIMTDRKKENSYETYTSFLSDPDARVRGVAAMEIVYSNNKPTDVKNSVTNLARFLLSESDNKWSTNFTKIGIIELLGKTATYENVEVIQILEKIKRNGFRKFDFWQWITGPFTFNFYTSGKKDAKEALRLIRKRSEYSDLMKKRKGI